MSITNPHASLTTPSAWVKRHLSRTPEGGAVLDLACGGGRHGRLFLSRGHPVTFADIDISGVSDLAGIDSATLMETDLETDAGWTLGDTRYAAVVVTNYLWRPILANVVASVAPGGVLIYETFAVGNEAYGMPKKPDFLLRPNELLRAVLDDLTVHAYEHGYQAKPRPSVIQRIAAVRD